MRPMAQAPAVAQRAEANVTLPMEIPIGGRVAMRVSSVLISGALFLTGSSRAHTHNTAGVPLEQNCITGGSQRGTPIPATGEAPPSEAQLQKSIARTQENPGWASSGKGGTQEKTAKNEEAHIFFLLSFGSCALLLMKQAAERSGGESWKRDKRRCFLRPRGHWGEGEKYAGEGGPASTLERRARRSA